MKKNTNFTDYELLLIFLFFLLCISDNLFAGGKTSIFRFLKESHSPRQISLGGVNSFFNADPLASFQNPAIMSINNENKKTFSFSGGSRLSSIDGATGGVALALPVNKNGNKNIVGFNLIYDGSIQQKTLAPSAADRYDFTSDGSFAAYSLSAGGYYSLPLPQGDSYSGSSTIYEGQTYFGIGVKMVVEKLYERSYPGLAVDAALIEEADNTTSFSIGVRNFGMSFANMPEGSYSLPTSGFLTILKKYKVVSFALDAEYDAQGFGDVKVGIETIFSKNFAFRVGFRHPFSEEDLGDFLLSRISAGFGIVLNKEGSLIFDYAWRSRGDLGSSHIMALRTYL